MPTADSYTIGQLARAAGVPTSTVRYYEKLRLLTPDARTGGNYRAYGQTGLQRLSFIRTAQAAGLSLDDVATLFSTVASGETPCPEVQAMLTKRLAEIEDAIGQLAQMKARVAEALAACRGGTDAGLCGTVVRLSKPSRRSQRSS